MRILVNDEEVDVEEQLTIAELLDRLGYPEKGIAVAVDWTVIPRSGWDSTLSPASRVEVVTAVQGG